MVSREGTREPTPIAADGSEGGGSSLGEWGVEELGAAGVAEQLGSALGGHAQAIYSIEQGQPGLRMLTQWAAVTSCLNSTMVCAGFPRSNVGVLHAVGVGTLPYLVAVCQVFFAIVAWVFEVELACVQRFSALDAFQDLLLDQTPWLADVGARGAFFFVQGAIWLLFVSTEEPHHFVIGVWLSVVAVCDVCVHFNVLPRRILAKTRRVRVENQVDLEELSKPVHIIGLHSASKVAPGNELNFKGEMPWSSRASSTVRSARQAELRTVNVLENSAETESPGRQASLDPDAKANFPSATKPSRGDQSPRGGKSPRGEAAPESPGEQPAKLASPSSAYAAQKIQPVVHGKSPEKGCCEVM